MNINNKIEEFLDEGQFGFRPGKCTREGIVALKSILERRIDLNRNTFVAFIDIEKAFDNVNWGKLLKCAKDIEIDWKDRMAILRLYENQEVDIHIGECKERAKVRKGVR